MRGWDAGEVSDAGLDVQELSIKAQMRTMVLEYLPTKLGHFGGFYVGKYSSTMKYRGTEIHV